VTSRQDLVNRTETEARELFEFIKTSKLGTIWYRDNTFICMNKCKYCTLPVDVNERLVDVNTVLSSILKLPFIHHFNSWKNDSVSICPLYRDHVHSESMAATMLDELLPVLSEK